MLPDKLVILILEGITMFKKFITQLFQKYAYKAVVYAEDLIGSGNGAHKKEIAIDYLLNKLPIYLKPFIPVLKPLLIQIADTLIEKAVEMLHTVQQQQQTKRKTK